MTTKPTPSKIPTVCSKSYEPNKRPPLEVLAESALSNNPYFAMGAGRILQVILFGFTGLRISSNGIEQKHPILPSYWRLLRIKGRSGEGDDFDVIL